MSDDEEAGPGGQNVSAASRSNDRRVRALKWIGGVVAAGVAGALTTLIVSGGSSVTGLFADDPPPPLHAVVISTSPAPDCEGGLGWVFPTSPGALPLPPRMWNEGRLDRWARANDGVAASGNYVAVELQGRGQRTVVLTGLRVRVIERNPAPHGSFPHFVPGCGGMTPSLYEANLDRRPVHVRPVGSGGDTGTGEMPASMPRRISNADPEVWHIRTTTETCSCSWVAEVDWVSDGRRGTLTIDDDGEPFRVASGAKSVPVEQRESGGWIEIDAPSLSIDHGRLRSISQFATVQPGDAVRLSASVERAGRLALFAQPLASDTPLRPIASAPVRKWGYAIFVQHPQVATRYRVGFGTDPAKMSEPATVRMKSVRSPRR